MPVNPRRPPIPTSSPPPTKRLRLTCMPSGAALLLIFIPLADRRTAAPKALSPADTVDCPAHCPASAPSLVPVRVILGCGWMLVIIMLEQCVVGVVGLEAAGSRIRVPSSTAPGAWLGHEPGDTKGQQRSRADSRDLAMTSANDLEQQRSRRHAVYGRQGVGVQIPSAPPQVRGPCPPSTVPELPASGSKLFCPADPVVRRGRALSVSSPGRPGAPRPSVLRYEGPDRPGSARSITDERHGDFVRLEPAPVGGHGRRR